MTVLRRCIESMNARLVNDYDFDHDPRTDCCGEIIRIFDYNRLRYSQYIYRVTMAVEFGFG